MCAKSHSFRIGSSQTCTERIVKHLLEMSLDFGCSLSQFIHNANANRTKQQAVKSILLTKQFASKTCSQLVFSLSKMILIN